MRRMFALFVLIITLRMISASPAIVIRSYPHDPLAFTQGLAFDDNGRMWESTGLYGQSTVRRVDYETGEVMQSYSMRQYYFGEGLCVWNREIIQLTWRNEIGFVYPIDLSGIRDDFPYHNREGWGITHDGRHLITSNGTDVLTFIDPLTFIAIKEIHVRLSNHPVTLINELEYVEGMIYANVWKSDIIVIIDPSTGTVDSVIDASHLRPQPSTHHMSLNGIAYDHVAQRLFITGKLWPTMYEIAVVER